MSCQIFFTDRCFHLGFSPLIVAKFYFVPWPDAFAGPHHCPPIVETLFRQQQEFNSTSTSWLESAQASGNNPGIIQHDAFQV
jgi:hypothetical protein